MENPGSVLFDDDDAIWYVATGNDQWMGPISAAEVYQKILDRQLNWAHHVWKKGMAEWKRICDTDPFRAALPQAPQKKPGAKSAAETPPPMPKAEEQVWFLAYNDSQYGPYGEGEVRHFLKAGKINGRVYVWKDGMEGWERLEKNSVFAPDVIRTTKTSSKPKPPPLRGSSPEEMRKSSGTRNIEPAEQRDSLRRPLVAKIIMADDESVIVGVCRDISIGGMQVLTNKVPGPVGTRLKMNVSPSGRDGIKKIQPFVAKGVIVRIVEGKRGFSFRFDRLTPNARAAIEEYINTTY